MENKITVHMVVKNEDRFLWYSIMSVINFVERIIIFDTGSEDNTVKVIKSINSKKIYFEQKRDVTKEMLTKLREEQIEMTNTDWFWVVDADEIYPEITAKEVVSNITKKTSIGGVVRRFDLLGDIYHYQSENVGSYNVLGERGHLVLRLLNKNRIPGLHLEGNYPYEGYYDGNKKEVIKYDKKDFFITKNRLFHAMYLKRSSLGGNLSNTLHRKKYKIETGNLFRATEQFPSTFFASHPTIVPSVLEIRDAQYDILAKIITPIKKIKRKIFRTA